MSEIHTAETRGRKNNRKRKILSTRVDLTPMVDLGFLLITFFIFTTTMSETKSMKVVLPSDEKPQTHTKVPESKTISLLLADDNTIYYYNGLSTAMLSKTDYSPAGIRAVLQQKIAAVNRMSGKNGETIVLIKPTNHASYRNLVDVLDEMLINDVKKYVLMEASGEEVHLLPISNTGKNTL